jgi:hypothetical protein
VTLSFYWISSGSLSNSLLSFFYAINGLKTIYTKPG